MFSVFILLGTALIREASYFLFFLLAIIDFIMALPYKILTTHTILILMVPHGTSW